MLTLSPGLRQKHISPEIRRAIDTQMRNAPPRVLDTDTGRFCNREAQISAFTKSTEYMELSSSTDPRSERIKDVVVTYFGYAMLSHRWDPTEPLLEDIQGGSVFELNSVVVIVKLQWFCKRAHDAGCRWAWSDTCCIDKKNNVELQQSIISMFVWYRYSAVTIVYLSDVLPGSNSVTLADSAWNERGWTVGEFLAPNRVLFYQKDWTLYRNDRSPNHKQSDAIMQELGHATRIDSESLVRFRPGVRDARKKLQWVSMRVTTEPEDTAYSLFGIFGITTLNVIYGEQQQNALGRLLQEIMAQSGDTSVLDWVGQSSEFNSCLPAEITSYNASPYIPPPLSEREMQESLSSLRNSVQSALNLYYRLSNMRAEFANRRLRLPCIAFRVTAIIQTRVLVQNQETLFTYDVKADGLRDLHITTRDELTQFSPASPSLRKFLLVRPWNRDLLELPDFKNHTEGEGERSSGANKSVRALRLVVRLGLHFLAFLLAQEWGEEYKRIASDRDNIGEVTDITSVHDRMDIKIVDIV